MANKDYDKDLFVPLEREDDTSEKISRPSLTFWQDSWMRLKKNTGALIGAWVLIIITFMALAGPFFNDYGFDEQNLIRSKLPPKVQGLENIDWLPFQGTMHRTFEAETLEDAKEDAINRFKRDEENIEMTVVDDGSNGGPAIVDAEFDVYANQGFEDEYFWFGTDTLGRDQWTRVWKGTQISLYIAVLAAFIDMVIGVAYGGISAYYGGRVDDYMQRIIEILIGIPNLVVVILMILILSPGILSITIALTITGWIPMARIIRGQVLKLKNQEFVLASRTLGASDSRIIMKQLVPNVTGLIVINTMFTIPGAIFFEAFLSFIGLGLQPPVASLGTLIDEGFQSLQTFPYLMIYPAIIISLIMIAFNIVADGLRDAFDPKMRE
ncbi:oligopeptide ABC transporter permease [Pontibacillus marinus]|uniref:Peptide ABC transporter permease n=1 Tax=Pontibacillus marinus BH030004 = DSM 16465 TaxID=1385511 RepID=A0A0A5G4N1_9BACI|nr:oligopeptide ABC transporter permease [Pontibacillus marinus]KGX86030.1 peptide ABC transporter permease [Pontibacillus marinus BH030004 = DSM 16465]